MNKIIISLSSHNNFLPEMVFQSDGSRGKGEFPSLRNVGKNVKKYNFRMWEQKKVINLKDGNFLSCLSKKKSPKIVIILEPFPPNGAVDPLLAFNYVENMSPNYYKSENNIIWSSCIEIRVPVFSFWLSFSFCLIVIAS